MIKRHKFFLQNIPESKADQLYWDQIENKSHKFPPYEPDRNKYMNLLGGHLSENKEVCIPLKKLQDNSIATSQSNLEQKNNFRQSALASFHL